MNQRPEFVKDEHLEFLDEIVGRHRIDLLDWRYLRDTFTDLTPEQAQGVISYWSETRQS